MDDDKRILVFSEAGGTGRSYHAELSARESAPARPLSARARLEGRCGDPGSRPHQPHQPGAAAAVPSDRHRREGGEALLVHDRAPPRHARRDHPRPAPDRRPGPVPAEDNLESHYGRDALRQLYMLLVRGKVDGCSLQTFEDATGLKLMDANGIKDELPPITTFLNRLLALTIDLQNVLFTAFEQLADRTHRRRGRVRDLRCRAGDAARRELRRHRPARRSTPIPAPARRRACFTITQRERNRPVTLDDALDRLSDPRAAAAGQRALRPRRRAGPGAESDARRRRDRAARAADPADGAITAIPLADDGAEPLGRSRPRDLRRRLASRSSPRCPAFTDSAISHRRPACCCRSGSGCRTTRCAVYRLQTDDGERIIGRLVSPAWVAQAADAETRRR